MRRAIVLLAVALTACGGKSRPAATPASTKAAATAGATPTATSAKVAIDPQDQAACQALYARLQRVTTALSSASELVASATDPKDLVKKIATEKEQFDRSAQLMDAAVVPQPLAQANRRLVAALRQYAQGFAKAEAPAKQGDFQSAAQAMTDKDAVTRIVASAQKIQDTCSP
jgi:hypothetical protein